MTINNFNIESLSTLWGITWVAKRVLPRLRECSRQVEAEAVSNSRNGLHQTRYKEISQLRTYSARLEAANN